MINKIKIILVTMVLAIATCSFMLDQDIRGIIDESSKALKNGDSEMLAKHFYQTIEMEILGEENFYSKSQASLLLKSFFTNNTPQSFVIAHDGFKDATAFAIGTLKTNTGTFRVSIFIKTENNKSYIHQLRIEKNS